MRRRTMFGLTAEYGEWSVFIEAEPTSVLNTGGVVHISATAKRTITYSDKTTEEEVIAIPVTVSGLSSSDNFADGVLTLSANSYMSERSIQVFAEHEGASAEFIIKQAAKNIASYGEWQISLTVSKNSITAASASVTLTSSASREVVYTDGSRTTESGTPTYTVSSGSVSGSTWSIPSNTSTSSITHTVTASYGGKSKQVTVNQNADAVATYGEVSLTTGTIEDVPASGGTRTSTGSSATQQLTWVSGRKTTVYPTITEGSTGTIDSKGTTISNRTSLGNVIISATGQGGKSATQTITAYQSGNYVTKVTSELNSFSYSTKASAAGGTITRSASSDCTLTFSSGATAKDITTTTAPDGGVLTMSRAYTGTATGASLSDGNVKWESRGTTIGNERGVEVTASVVYTYTHDSTYSSGGTVTGTTATKKATCYQSGNYVTGVSTVIKSFSYDSKAEASGGTVSKARSSSCTLTFSSGENVEGVTESGGYTGGTVTLATDTYAGSATGASLSSGDVTWSDRSTTIGNERGIEVTITRNYSFIHNSTYSTGGTITGSSASKKATCYQKANLVTKIEANSNSFSYAAIGAGATSATATTSHAPKYTFSSSATSTTTPSSTYGTLATSVTYSIANTTTNGFTAVNATTGALTATSRGTTYGASGRTSATVTKTLKYTWTHTSTYGSSSVNTGNLTKTATCTQNANLITGLEIQNPSAGALTAPGTYAAKETTQSVANKTAASCGCKVTFSSGGSSVSYSTWVNLTTTYSWSSNQSYATLTSANASSLNVKMSSRGTTTGDARSATITRKATFSASLKSEYSNATAVSTSASCTATVTQEKNAANASSAITSWGTPSALVFGSPGITAAGGSAALSCTVPKNTRTYYYTSGSAGSTAQENATVAYSITKQTLSTSSAHGSTTISRFTISGSKLSHTTMGTNTGYDVVTVRCYNSGSTGKYVENTTFVQNGITSYAPTATLKYNDAKPSSVTYNSAPRLTVVVVPKYTSGSQGSSVTLTSSDYTVQRYRETTLSDYATVRSDGYITWNANQGVTTDYTVGVTVYITLSSTYGGVDIEGVTTARRLADSISSATYTWSRATVSYSSAPATGGTITPSVSVSVTRDATWASGYTNTSTITTLSGKMFYLTNTGGTTGSYGTINSSTGAITWSSHSGSSSRSMKVYATLQVDNGASMKDVEVNATQAAAVTMYSASVTFTNNTSYSGIVVRWKNGAGMEQSPLMVTASPNGGKATITMTSSVSGSVTFISASPSSNPSVTLRVSGWVSLTQSGGSGSATITT